MSWHSWLQGVLWRLGQWRAPCFDQTRELFDQVREPFLPRQTLHRSLVQKWVRTPKLQRLQSVTQQAPPPLTTHKSQALSTSPQHSSVKGTRVSAQAVWGSQAACCSMKMQALITPHTGTRRDQHAPVRGVINAYMFMLQQAPSDEAVLWTCGQGL